VGCGGTVSPSSGQELGRNFNSDEQPALQQIRLVSQRKTRPFFAGWEGSKVLKGRAERRHPSWEGESEVPSRSNCERPALGIGLRAGAGHRGWKE
jgi:hypothetical protein